MNNSYILFVFFWICEHGSIASFYFAPHWTVTTTGMYALFACRCTHIWINVGLHTLMTSARYNDTIWSPEMYLAHSLRIASKLSSLSLSKGDRVFWESTRPMALGGNHFNVIDENFAFKFSDNSQITIPRVSDINALAECRVHVQYPVY